MKKLVTLLLALVATTALWAEDFSAGGIYYNILTDKTNEVEVTSGSSKKYSGSVTILSTVTYNGTTYSVTSIGDWAFYECSGLTSVTIGNSVTEIGEFAFDGCTSLTSVTIPNSITSIGDCAFRDCKSLTSVTVGNSVTSIGVSAFADCSGLTSITIGNSVTSIGPWAFFQCSGLTSVTIGNSVTDIGECAFDGCTSLTSITIPNSVTSIGYGAFWSCSGLTSIVVEKGNTVYDSREICNAIIETATNTLIVGCQNTIIPNSVTSIGDRAFSSCTGLTSIAIPNSVTSIGEAALIGCTGLTSVIVEEGNTIYDSRENCNAIIETATNTLIKGCQNTTIPNSVTSIGLDAFRGCEGLTSITIPNSVTEIGGGAFGECTGLTSIIIPNSVTSIGRYAFCECYGLTSVTIGNSVTSIGNWAFIDCFGLTSVTIGNSVTSIGEGAFAYCESLKEVICYAEKVPQMGEEVFAYTPQSEATLYVLADALVDYKIAEQWKEFGTILPIQETDTDLENIHSQSPMTNCQKVIRDGQLIILRDGKSYSVMGQEL